jgi:hypothetical protein
MDKDEMYDILTKKLQPYAAQLEVGQQTMLDGDLWAVAQELAEKLVANPSK